MKYLEQEQVVQLADLEPGEEEEPSQKSPHRAQSLHTLEPPNSCRVVKQQRIKWPPAGNQSEWLQFDKDTSGIIQTTARGDADSWLRSMTAIIVSYASERFDHIEIGNTKPTIYTMNCRVTKINHLWQEI